MTTCDDWAQALLAFGEWAVTMEHRTGLVSWAMAEGDISVPRCSGAPWNPLDTTEPGPGATDWNSAGVKAYPTQQAGLEAVYATLHNGYYPGILGWLETEGSAAIALGPIVGASPWGTGNFTAATEQVKADPAKYFAVVVPGSPAPDPDPPKPDPWEADLFTISSDSGPGIFGCDGHVKWVLSAAEYATLKALPTPPQNVHVAHENDDGFPVIA